MTCWCAGVAARLLRALQTSIRAARCLTQPRFLPFECAQKAIGNLYTVMTHMQSMSLMVQISSAVRTIGSGTKVAAEVMHQMNEMSKKDSTMTNINDFGKEAKELQLSVGGCARAALVAGARARQMPAGTVRKSAGRPAVLAPGRPLAHPSRSAPSLLLAAGRWTISSRAWTAPWQT